MQLWLNWNAPQTLSLMFATTLVACGSASRPVVLRPDASGVRVAKAEPPSECVEFAPIEAVHGSGCGGFGSKGTYEGAYVTLKNMAAERGANYVRIDQEVGPHSEYGCFDQRFVMRGVAFTCK